MLTYTNRLIHDDPKGIRYCVGVKGIYPELQTCDEYNLTQKYVCCLCVGWSGYHGLLRQCILVVRQYFMMYGNYNIIAEATYWMVLNWSLIDGCGWLSWFVTVM